MIKFVGVIRNRYDVKLPFYVESLLREALLGYAYVSI